MTEAASLLPGGVLSRLARGEAEALADRLALRELADREQLWEEEKGPRDLYFILEGTIELSCRTGYPGRRVVMALLGPGSVVGETCFSGSGETILAALSKGVTRVGVLSREEVARLSEKAPELHAHLAGEILRILALRLEQAYSRMAAVF